MLSINQPDDSTSKKVVTQSPNLTVSKYDSGMNRSIESMRQSSNLSGPSIKSSYKNRNYSAVAVSKQSVNQ